MHTPMGTARVYSTTRAVGDFQKVPKIFTFDGKSFNKYFITCKRIKSKCENQIQKSKVKIQNHRTRLTRILSAEYSLRRKFSPPKIVSDERRVRRTSCLPNVVSAERRVCRTSCLPNVVSAERRVCRTSCLPNVVSAERRVCRTSCLPNVVIFRNCVCYPWRLGSGFLPFKSPLHFKSRLSYFKNTIITSH